MAITDKTTGVWGLDQVYNKENQGSIWSYTGQPGFWGSGNSNTGVLLNHHPGNYSSPVQLGSDTTWSTDLGKFAVTPYNNRYHVLAIKTDGTLWAWGKGDEGVLGLNDKVNRSSPTQIPGTDWSTCSGCYESLLAIKTDGTLWAWGSGHAGQLAQNNRTTYSSPRQIPGTTWAPGGVISKEGAMVAKTDGTLWMWGSNDNGVLGQNQAEVNPIKKTSSPVQIPGTTWSTTAGKLAMVQGNNAAGAIKTDGTLWVWGKNTYGQLGQNESQAAGVANYSSPVQIPGTTWKYIMHNGSSNFLATKTDGTLWAWGSGPSSKGQLGQGNNSSYSSPAQIPGTTWNRPNGSDYYNTITKTDGTLWVTGNPQKNVIGLNEGQVDANPTGSPIQCGGYAWVEAKGNTAFMIGTAQAW